MPVNASLLELYETVTSSNPGEDDPWLLFLCVCPPLPPARPWDYDASSRTGAASYSIASEGAQRLWNSASCRSSSTRGTGRRGSFSAI
jgi:hypothetical protein